MKTLLVLLLAFSAAHGQVRVINYAQAIDQAARDSVQNAQISAMTTMTQTVATDDYANVVGNVLTALGVGVRKGAYNTTLPLTETWVGTSAGNRLATMRIVDYPVTVAAGQTVITIPHGLPYTPVVQVSVKSPAGVGNPSYTVNATNIVVTLPTAPLVATPYIFNWMGR